MMRYAILLALISLATLLPPQVVKAQNISFSRAEILNLASAIVSETSRTPQLPSAYMLTMTNGHTMVITAPNAFELLCRSILIWRQAEDFPLEVSIEFHDLKGPSPDDKHEPRSPGTLIAMPVVDIDTYAPPLLEYASQRRLLMTALKTQASTMLTAAQIIVAMAMLIDEAQKKQDVPDAVVMPLVRSPQNWLDTSRPVRVTSAPRVVVPVVVNQDIDLRISLNGIELSETGPILPSGNGPIPPFCGTIRIAVSGSGPVETVRLLLDKVELTTFRSVGPHSYALNTIPLSDGLHMIVATATNSVGKTFSCIFSFMVQNGRKSGFTPAQLGDLELGAEARPPMR